MTRREELRAMTYKLIAISNDRPQNIPFGAAQNLADATKSIERALQYAVDAEETRALRTEERLEELRAPEFEESTT